MRLKILNCTSLIHSKELLRAYSSYNSFKTSQHVCFRIRWRSDRRFDNKELLLAIARR